MKKQQLIVLIFIMLLAACGSNEPAVTPPIVPASTAAPESESAPAAAVTAVPATNTPAVTEPEAPTADPTVDNVQPADTATPVPTPTPAPSAVNAVQLIPVAGDGLRLPIYLTHAGDERLFVVQQNGVIRIIEAGVVIEEPFLNIRDRVGADANEQGLLSLAFHPDYATNGEFYVNYTNRQFHTTISRFLVDNDDPNRADANSEEMLLTIEQPFPNHNGGLVKFGPDGYLYIGMGDGGSQGDPQGNGQNTGSLLGAVLRLDVNIAADAPYGIPASNPFVADDSARNEIWATGVRNPWRFSFDRSTGDMFMGDVGQNNWEEINWQPAAGSGGENYGWDIVEASACYRNADCAVDGLAMPIFEYEHSQGCSVTGGYVYRGERYPSLQGNYFLGDFCTGFIWRLFPGPDGNWQADRVLESGLDIASFGEDVDGELYVVSRNTGIYHLQP